MAKTKQNHLFVTLDTEQRKFASKHIMNLGYGILAATAFRYFAGDFEALPLVLLGIINYAWLFYTALRLKRGTHEPTSD